ncbi:hypothetical protein V8D89_006633 [Ganoderma adspersum]
MGPCHRRPECYSSWVHIGKAKGERGAGQGSAKVCSLITILSTHRSQATPPTPHLGSILYLALANCKGEEEQCCTYSQKGMETKERAHSEHKPARLLCYPDSTLLFASFSPLIFSGPSLFTDALPRAYCIVVEVPHMSNFSERPNFFSFVPNVVLAPRVASEGKWPRVMDYCRRRVVCDQDQWDIHKLDPVYNCFVPTTGMYLTITRKINAQFLGGSAQTHPRKSSQSEAQDSDNEHSASDVPMRKTTPIASLTFTVFASSDGFTSLGNPATLQSEASFSSLMFLASPSMPESPPESIPSSSMVSVITVWPGTTDLLPKWCKHMVLSSSAPCLPSATPAESSKPNIACQGITASVAPSFTVGPSNETDPNAPEPVPECSTLLPLASVASRPDPTLSKANTRPDKNAAHQAFHQQAVAQDAAQVLFTHPEPEIDQPIAIFSPVNPVDPLCIPWLSPRIDWQIVEAFFKEASHHMCVDHYKKRFHPDCWHSRGVFRTDDTCASMIILQALSPIRDTIKFPEAEAD